MLQIYITFTTFPSEVQEKILHLLRNEGRMGFNVFWMG